MPGEVAAAVGIAHEPDALGEVLLRLGEGIGIDALSVLGRHDEPLQLVALRTEGFLCVGHLLLGGRDELLHGLGILDALRAMAGQAVLQRLGVLQRRIRRTRGR